MPQPLPPWLESRFPALRQRFVSPSGEGAERRSALDDRPLPPLPVHTPQQIPLAAAEARAAQSIWRTTAPSKRAELLLRFHDLLLRHQSEALDLIQLESGKARRHAFEEVVDLALVARHAAIHGPSLLAPRRRRGLIPGLTKVTEWRRPNGIVAVIAPWNYPLSMALGDALPALMAGNGVLLRPDSQALMTAAWGADLLDRAGLPPGLLQLVSGDGPVLGPALIAAADFVQFTGSTATGRLVARQAAERLVGCSLELGGKNAMIVCGDAALDRAVRGAIHGCFASSGQLCMSIERIFLERTIAERFTAQFVAEAGRLTLGNGLDWNSDCGPLISEQHLARVAAQVDEARRGGARLLLGGEVRHDLGPRFFPPTILSGVTPGMSLFAEESFGPVVTLATFERDEEAIAAANDVRYGLNASVWSRDRDRALQIASALEAGTVGINDPYGAVWGSIDAPMGGTKDSGLGRRHGVEGILKFTEAQTIAAQRGVELAAPPASLSAAFARQVTALLRWVRRMPGLR